MSLALALDHPDTSVQINEDYREENLRYESQNLEDLECFRYRIGLRLSRSLYRREFSMVSGPQ